MSTQPEIPSVILPEQDPLAALELHFQSSIGNLNQAIMQSVEENDFVNREAEEEVMLQAIVSFYRDAPRGIRAFFRKRAAKNQLEYELGGLDLMYLRGVRHLRATRNRYAGILDDVRHGSTMSARIEFLTDLNHDQSYLNATQNLYMYSDTDNHPPKKKMIEICDSTKKTTDLLALINPAEAQEWAEYFADRKRGVVGMRAQFLP